MRRVTLNKYHPVIGSEFDSVWQSWAVRLLGTELTERKAAVWQAVDCA